MPIKLLIGGSPCTHWSIAQNKNREVEPEGEGWELFKNFLIAKEKFQPDFFLYENNKSAAQAIKDQIAKELGVGGETERLTHINSALVSAQRRQRFYVTNFGDIEQPKDRGILLRDILESGEEHGEPVGVGFRNRREMDGKLYRRFETQGEPKSNALTTVQTDSMCASPVKVGCLPSPDGTLKDSQGMRLYSNEGKSVSLTANGGGPGAKTGLYAIPSNTPTYEVKNGLIEIKGKEYPIKLKDGYYIIRKLTVTECCRLQTLPDNYCKAVSKTQAYKGLGNGWTAEVIIHLLNHALKDVPRDEKITVLSMYDGIGTGLYCLKKMGFTNIEYHAYEIDKYAIQVAMDNHPEIIQHGNAFDVRNQDWKL